MGSDTFQVARGPTVDLNSNEIVGRGLEMARRSETTVDRFLIVEKILSVGFDTKIRSIKHIHLSALNATYGTYVRVHTMCPSTYVRICCLAAAALPGTHGTL